MGELLRGKTVLLVTQNVALAGPIADFIVAFGSDGEFVARDSHDEVLPTLVDEEAIDEAEDLEEGDGPEPEPSVNGKLVVEEGITKGHVSLRALMLFWTSLGGRHPILFWVNFVVGMLAYRVLANLQPFWMGRWADAYIVPGPVNVTYYLVVFLLLVLGTLLAFTGANTTLVFGVVRAARRIHAQLMNSVLGTTLRWVDSTPSSRIITRCTKDLKAIDGQLAFQFKWLVSFSAQVIVQLTAIALVAPVMILPGLFILAAGIWIGNIYMKTQLPVKRELSNKKAPVLGHFSAAVAGLVSIRAYGAQDAFRHESYRRIDEYTRVGRTLYNLGCWVSVRSDTLGALLLSILGAYMVYGPGAAAIGASNAGFALSMAAAFSQLMMLLVRVYNEFEIEGNSLERIKEYLDIEQEPKPVLERKPPASWPASGELRVEGLSARYSHDGPNILHNLSFAIKSGERIGIIGRTGSGKSSLTLSLLRCILTEGSVHYDGVDTANLNLDELRAQITIIPQVPQLLSGTLRENLDPFDEYDDAMLNSALRASGLLSLQGETGESRITLDSQVASGGGNLSVGQRQILALARALVRGSKLLILDEATSSIDYETDTVIQSSLRKELGRDVTLLTVAHRLQTIMDADRIMVLDAGRIVEYDDPRVLLQRPGGYFKSLVDESGDKGVLYTMAGSKL